MANSLWLLVNKVWRSKLMRVGVYGARFGQRFIGIYALLTLVYSLQFGFPVYGANSSQKTPAPQSSTSQVTFTISADER